MNDIITTACKFVTSSIGRKILVALTGSCLLLFLVGHLAGNMTIYGGCAGEGGTSWIDFYATGLHSMPAWLLWAIRLGLLAVALIHIVLTLVLFGVVMIFSSSYYYTMTSAKYEYDMLYFLKSRACGRCWVL